MQGLDVLHPTVQDEANRVLRVIYGDTLCDTKLMEDAILFTRRRSEFPNIGTDKINLRPLMYILENIFWINVCLFVNEDFRACFDDAITIEKALLRVNDQEYEDFRDEMKLASGDSDPDKAVDVDLMSYGEDYGMAVEGRVETAKSNFYKSGMTEVYNELMSGFDPKSRASVMYVIHNLVYVVNSFNRNEVFRKYVMLVVDSVRRQLA